MGLLDGKVALITGAGSGFGEAAAKTFATEGAKVAVADIDVKNGARVADEICNAGGEAVFVKVDVSSVAEVEAMVRTTADSFGKLDIFWHNAGNVGPGSIEDTDEASYQMTMDIHVKGGFFGAKFAVEEMKKVGGGVILFTSSLAGIKTSRASTAYGVAKGALVSLTRNLTLSFAPYQVRVNSICPGAAETPLWPAFTNRGTSDYDLQKTEEVSQMYKQKTPLGRLTDVQDVADAAAFLCSDKARYITGQLLSVDGGLSVL
jgi:NAD(P)-dependent dehydrogenase (short-subunit alcohol dehydrogenase family)|tara:strand:- start:28239 stop:29021 length:783 start_codon:yes stop_codon:yes gene_type:complete